MELFKLLTAISLEIHQLQQTTESRLSRLETMVAKMIQKESQLILPGSARLNNFNDSDCSGNTKVSTTIYMHSFNRDRKQTFLQESTATLHSTTGPLGQSKGELIANSMIANWQRANSEAAGRPVNSSADTNRSINGVNRDIDAMLQKNKALNVPVSLKIGGTSYEVC